MTAAKVRLLVAAALFLVWIGYLGYLASPTTTSRDVLSRPQFLISTLDVIAWIDGDGGPSTTIRVAEVAWPPSAQGKRAGKELRVHNLPESRGWAGPGLYILPLVQHGADYHVAGIPRSPGTDPSSRQPRIYPATPLNREQLQTMPKPAEPAE